MQTKGSQGLPIERARFKTAIREVLDLIGRKLALKPFAGLAGLQVMCTCDSCSGNLWLNFERSDLIRYT